MRADHSSNNGIECESSFLKPFSLLSQVFSQFQEFNKAISLHLVEVSPKMRQLQSEALTGESTPEDTAVESQRSKYGPDVHWHRFLEQVPNERSCVIAHEFFDVLPIYKFQVPVV